jgi:hypothetical protein
MGPFQLKNKTKTGGDLPAHGAQSQQRGFPMLRCGNNRDQSRYRWLDVAVPRLNSSEKGRQGSL